MPSLIVLTAMIGERSIMLNLPGPVSWRTNHSVNIRHRAPRLYSTRAIRNCTLMISLELSEHSVLQALSYQRSLEKIQLINNTKRYWLFNRALRTFIGTVLAAWSFPSDDDIYITTSFMLWIVVLTRLFWIEVSLTVLEHLPRIFTRSRWGRTHQIIRWGLFVDHPGLFASQAALRSTGFSKSLFHDQDSFQPADYRTSSLPRLFLQCQLPPDLP